MKNTIQIIIAGFAIVYLIKKGLESGKETGENLNFFDSLKRGFELTVQSFSSDSNSSSNEVPGNKVGFVDDKTSNDEMVSFTPEYNSFKGASLKKKRGMFHYQTIESAN